MLQRAIESLHTPLPGQMPTLAAINYLEEPTQKSFRNYGH